MLRQPSRGFRTRRRVLLRAHQPSDRPCTGANYAVRAHASRYPHLSGFAGLREGTLLLESGQALCWGNSDWLQTGSDSDLPVPLDSLAQVSAPNNVEFVQLALGSEHSCAIVRDRA